MTECVSLLCQNIYSMTLQLQLTYMLWEFDAFDCNIKGGCVFIPGVLPPPFDHLNHFRLSLCPRWRAEELEAEFTVNIQHAVCANQLEDTGKKMMIKRSNKTCRWVFSL